jgi:hypothetical protein
MISFACPPISFLGANMPQSAELLDAKDLIACHEQWKLTLWAAAFSHKPLTLEQVEQIVHADRCAIGRWLEAADEPDLRASEEFRLVVENHNEFHGEMMQVAALLARKNYSAAARAIGEQSSFAETGRQLAASIFALNRIKRIQTGE